jgi:uncharacterized protein (TIGR03663 family)
MFERKNSPFTSPVAQYLPWVVFAIALLWACWLRFGDLGARPMHTDEAVHGVKIGKMLRDGYFDYDPSDYHGPTLHFSAALWGKVKGWSDINEYTEIGLRQVTVIFGILLVASLVFFRKSIGSVGVAFAALLAATSPMLVYYSRYFVMEILLGLLLLLFTACLHAYGSKKSWGAAVGLGATAGLMHATKETFVIFAGCLVFAALLNGLFKERLKEGRIFEKTHPGKTTLLHVILAIVVMSLVSATLFSSFFRNTSDIPESYQTYALYFSKAGGTDFAQPWYYYLSLLCWKKEGLVFSECLTVFLGLIGLARAYRETGRSHATLFVRTVGLGALLSLFVLSLFSYKTPWSILPAWVCWLIPAGYGARYLFQLSKALWWKALVIASLGWFLWFSHKRDVLLNGRWASGPNNPYAFSHTSPDLVRLTQRIKAYAKLDDRGKDLPVKIFHPEFGWPVPWYLRDFTRLGTWSEWESDPHAAVVIIPLEWYDGAMGRLGRNYHFEMVGLRPGLNLAVFVENSLWEKGKAAQTAGTWSIP